MAKRKITPLEQLQAGRAVVVAGGPVEEEEVREALENLLEYDALSPLNGLDVWIEEFEPSGYTLAFYQNIVLIMHERGLIDASRGWTLRTGAVPTGILRLRARRLGRTIDLQQLQAVVLGERSLDEAAAAVEAADAEWEARVVSSPAPVTVTIQIGPEALASVEKVAEALVPEVIGAHVLPEPPDEGERMLPSWTKAIGTKGAILVPPRPADAEPLTREQAAEWLWNHRWKGAEPGAETTIGIVHPDHPHRYGVIDFGGWFFVATFRIERRRVDEDAARIATDEEAARREANGEAVEFGTWCEINAALKAEMLRTAIPSTRLIPVVWDASESGGRMYVADEVETIRGRIGWLHERIEGALSADQRDDLSRCVQSAIGSPGGEANYPEKPKKKRDERGLGEGVWADFMLWLWTAQKSRGQAAGGSLVIPPGAISIQERKTHGKGWRKATVESGGGLVEAALARGGRIARLDLELYPEIEGTREAALTVDVHPEDGLRLVKVTPPSEEGVGGSADELHSAIFSRMAGYRRAHWLVQQLVQRWAADRLKAEGWRPVLTAARARVVERLAEFLYDPKTGQGFLFGPERAGGAVGARLALPDQQAERRL